MNRHLVPLCYTVKKHFNVAKPEMQPVGDKTQVKVDSILFGRHVRLQ